MTFKDMLQRINSTDDLLRQQFAYWVNVLFFWYEVEIKKEDIVIQEAVDWLHDHSKKAWVILLPRKGKNAWIPLRNGLAYGRTAIAVIRFRSKKDALLFKLTWG